MKEWKHKLYSVNTKNKECIEYTLLDQKKIIWGDEKILPLESCDSIFGITPQAYNDGRRALIYYKKELDECSGKSKKMSDELATLKEQNQLMKNQIHELEVLLMNEPLGTIEVR